MKEYKGLDDEDYDIEYENFEDKPNVYKLLTIAMVILFLVCAVSFIAINHYKKGKSDIEKYDYDSSKTYPNSFADLSDDIDLTKDKHVVGFYDVEDKIEFLKIEGSIYLVPKKDSDIEVYKNDSGKHIIKIK